MFSSRPEATYEAEWAEDSAGTVVDGKAKDKGMINEGQIGHVSVAQTRLPNRAMCNKGSLYKAKRTQSEFYVTRLCIVN